MLGSLDTRVDAVTGIELRSLLRTQKGTRYPRNQLESDKTRVPYSKVSLLSSTFLSTTDAMSRTNADATLYDGEIHRRMFQHAVRTYPMVHLSVTFPISSDISSKHLIQSRQTYHPMVRRTECLPAMCMLHGGNADQDVLMDFSDHHICRNKSSRNLIITALANSCELYYID
jgi:hypothetical protein